jgi:peptidoglycan/xylan/chitin deacetylase (PgdA/CDA1 family)
MVLAMVLSVASAPAVFAQSEVDADAFAWPLQQWQDAVEAQADGPRDKPPAAKLVRKGPSSSNAVALTFDDGYSSRACSRIANTLRKHHAVGTFFVNGRYLKAEPAKWRRILEGMAVGNHTRSHPDLTSERHPVVIKQISQNEAIHEEVLGRPMLKVLRPPYGAYGERVGRIARQLGYKHIALWNVDTQDWKPRTKPRSILRRATGAPAGSIILMHCSRAATVKALPKIIRHYQRRGIELRGLDKVIRGAKAARRDSVPGRYDG